MKRYFFVVVVALCKSSVCFAAESANADMTVGVCSLIEATAPSTSAANVVSPSGAAYQYLTEIAHRAVTGSAAEASVTVVEQPQHGLLIDQTAGIGHGFYSYKSAASFEGYDHATFVVERGRYRVKVFYSFHVLAVVPDGSDEWDPYEDKKYCPNGPLWEIGRSPSGSGVISKAGAPNSPQLLSSHPRENP